MVLNKEQFDAFKMEIASFDGPELGGRIISDEDVGKVEIELCSKVDAVFGIF